MHFDTAGTSPRDDFHWGRWFAWHPVYIFDAGVWIWLETVERRRVYSEDLFGISLDWEYNLRPRTIERIARARDKRSEWRPWFAWRPVEIDGRSVWLEFVERRRIYGHSSYVWDHRRPNADR
jgi:hypothetical protein